MLQKVQPVKGLVQVERTYIPMCLQSYICKVRDNSACLFKINYLVTSRLPDLLPQVHIQLCVDIYNLYSGL